MHDMDAVNVSRKPFTPEQLAAADKLGYITDGHWEKRRETVVHAIDNVTPDIAADRDDAIYVQTAANGEGSIVEVTIADVAAQVPLDNVLADAAHDRAFTVYRPQMNDPMFPKPLEDRMSLEHQQPRLGLTVHTERDKDTKTTYLEFERTIAHPDNSDYAMAQQRMREEPQFQLMNDIANTMRDHIKVTAPSAYDEMKAARKGGLTSDQLKASKMVETYMLDTNFVTADFFERAKLPFIYRNFEDDAKDDKGISRAYYGTRRKRHDALKRDGLTGGYCHFTSPIRRAPDYYNAHMVHYVIDGIELLEREMMQSCPELDTKTIHRALWSEAAGLFALNQEAKPVGIVRLAGILSRMTDGRITQDACARISGHFLAMKPPLTISQLDRFVKQINTLNYQEQMSLSSPQLQQWLYSEAKQRETSEAIACYTPSQFADMESHKFSSLLRNAARCGVMNDTLKQEVIKRIESYQEANGSSLSALVQDAFSILIVSVNAQGQSNIEWNELRKTACRAIKHNPSVVNSLLELGVNEHYFERDGILEDEPRVTLPVAPAQVPEREENIEAALCTSRLRDTGQIIAAPYYSVGHDSRSVLSHARYSFLEHYAFGQLRPIDQSSVPNLLYADLDQPDADRRKLVDGMVATVGAQLIIARDNRYDPPMIRAVVKGGTLKEVIVAMAQEKDPKLAESRAIKRLLRLPAFKSTFHFSNLEGMQQLVKPYALLRDELAKRDVPLISFMQQKNMRGGQTQFSVSLHTDDTGKPITFEGVGPNKDRALHEAARAALEHFGWLPNNPAPHAGSWVMGRAQEPGASSPSAVL